MRRSLLLTLAVLFSSLGAGCEAAVEGDWFETHHHDGAIRLEEDNTYHELRGSLEGYCSCEKDPNLRGTWEADFFFNRVSFKLTTDAGGTSLLLDWHYEVSEDRMEIDCIEGCGVKVWERADPANYQGPCSSC